MATERGKKVKIRVTCRSQQGEFYRVGERDTLEFTLGADRMPAALEAGLRGMTSGERRNILVPAAEVKQFPFAKLSGFLSDTKTPPGIAYEFGPGNGGDVLQSISGGEPKSLRNIPDGVDLIFEVEMLKPEGG